MPSAIFGPVHIDSVNGGVVEFGDNLTIEPKSTAKSYAGSGSFHSGDFHINNNSFNLTKGVDPDVFDASNVANR